MIVKLGQAEPGTRERALYDAFETAKRVAEASSVFARVPEEDCGRFPLAGRGDVNTYALFAELFADLAGPPGRAGVIVPTGIATDATTAPFFASLVNRNRLAQLTDFENRNAIFPAVHRSYKFCLLTIGYEVDEADFAFFLTESAQLAEPERRFTLSPADIARINPNTRTAPVFRSREDARLAATIHERVPVLIDESKGAAGNQWGARMTARIWHMAEDAEFLKTSLVLEDEGYEHVGATFICQSSHKDDCYLPLYEAKMTHQYDHRWATYDAAGAVSREVLTSEKNDPDFEVLPRYYVPLDEVENRLLNQSWKLEWLLGWRKIARSNDERTMIVSIIPRFGVGDSMLLMYPNQNARNIVALQACLNSLPHDFVVRQKVGGVNVSFHLVNQFPVLPPTAYTEDDLDFIVPRVLELSYTSWSLKPFAVDLGYDGPPFAWDEDRRARLRAELDAWYARAYGLTRDELRYVLDPADVKGPDYPSETFRVLKKNEIARYGEYRTARLVLAAWDAQEARPAAAQ